MASDILRPGWSSIRCIVKSEIYVAREPHIFTERGRIAFQIRPWLLRAHMEVV